MFQTLSHSLPLAILCPAVTSPRQHRKVSQPVFETPACLVLRVANDYVILSIHLQAPAIRRFGENHWHQCLALAATKSNVELFEQRRAEYEERAAQTLSAAEARVAKLSEAQVTIAANASTEGKLYGSVGPRDIADAFTAAGMPLEKSEVVMGEGPLRRIGEFEVEVHLHADVHTTVKVNIVPES